MQTAKGAERAEVFRGYFELQLRFADVLAAHAPMPLSEAITFHTNLHRRLGYGNLARMPPDPAFIRLAEDIATVPGLEARTDRAIAAHAARPEEALPPGQFPFGCFACEAPDARGHVRIHFGSRDSDDGAGPLARAKIGRRRAELTAMCRFIAATSPDATAIDGGSWAYNLESYRRLFPPEFIAALAPLEGPRPTHGSSSWGQLLDFRGYVKPDIRAQFIARLDGLDREQPWLVFPLPVLITSAPFRVFKRHYGA